MDFEIIDFLIRDFDKCCSSCAGKILGFCEECKTKKYVSHLINLLKQDIDKNE